MRAGTASVGVPEVHQQAVMMAGGSVGARAMLMPLTVENGRRNRFFLPNDFI